MNQFNLPDKDLVMMIKKRFDERLRGKSTSHDTKIRSLEDLYLAIEGKPLDIWTRGELEFALNLDAGYMFPEQIGVIDQKKIAKFHSRHENLMKFIEIHRLYLQGRFDLLKLQE